jgi:uncharacterized protein involved in cysteine biosynthesis
VPGRPRQFAARLVFAAMQFAWKFGVIMLVALVVVVLPGGGNALDVILTFLTIAFLAAIAFLGYRLYHQYRLDIDSLAPNLRLALFGSIGLAILTFVATDRLFDEGGIGVLVWFALLALCSYGLYWTWTRYRSYE